MTNVNESPPTMTDPPPGRNNPLPARPAELPRFSAPPVDEVVIGLRFTPIQGFEDRLVGEYRSSVVAQFPGIQYQPRLESPVDTLADLPQPMPLVFGAPPAFGRTWLISADDTRLIQLQNDFFLYNWRRRGEHEYPHFEVLYEEFWRYFTQLRDLVQQQGSSIRLQQIETTYINWVRRLTFDQFLTVADASRIHVPHLDEVPHQQQWAGNYFLRNEANQPIARLGATYTPALRLVPGGDAERGIQLTLIVRMPLAPGISDGELASLLGLSRNSIVWCFAELTKETAQEGWGRHV